MMLTLCGIVVMAGMVDRLPKNPETSKLTPWEAARKNVSVFFSQMKEGRQLCMAVLNVYIGMTLSFGMADLTNVSFRSSHLELRFHS